MNDNYYGLTKEEYIGLLKECGMCTKKWTYAKQKQFDERRKVKNELALINIFQQNSNKLINLENRRFLITTLGKESKKLINSKYTYKKISKEQIIGE